MTSAVVPPGARAAATNRSTPRKASSRTRPCRSSRAWTGGSPLRSARKIFTLTSGARPAIVSPLSSTTYSVSTPSELAEGVDHLVNDLAVRIVTRAIDDANHSPLRMKGDAGMPPLLPPLVQELGLSPTERVRIAVLAD